MAVIRGPRTGGEDETTRRVESGDPYGERTVVARPRSQDRTVAANLGSTDRTVSSASDDERTRLVGTRPSHAAPAPRDSLDDPVVGWLVIVDGPGKGMALKIGYGQNSLGRAPGQRIRLDFGDDQISREGHAFVTYDPKGRKFYVMNGGGSNLIYIADTPVLMPTELQAQTKLTLGSTTLCFVPFCGADFDWQDSTKGAA